MTRAYNNSPPPPARGASLIAFPIVHRILNLRLGHLIAPSPPCEGRIKIDRTVTAIPSRDGSVSCKEQATGAVEDQVLHPAAGVALPFLGSSRGYVYHEYQAAKHALIPDRNAHHNLRVLC
jgi:hypothetical protein